MFVCATAGVCANGPTAASLMQSIHEVGLDPAECYRVRDLSFRKEDASIYFTDGYLIFSKPVLGVRISAVFTADVEGGDGEVIVLPPNRGERMSLAKFTQSPNLDEHIVAAMLVFTDGTAETLRARMEKDEAGKKAPEVGALMAERWSTTLASIRESFEIRMVDDLLSPDPKKTGFMFMGMLGRERGNFDLLYDPRARDQIVIGQLAEHSSRPRYNIWTSFVSKSVRTGAATRVEPAYSLSHFAIDASLDSDLHMKATTRVKVRLKTVPLRSLVFEISSAMKVTSVTVDGAPAEVVSKDSVRGRALRGSQDDAVLVVTANPLAAGSEHEFVFEHEGDVILSAGNGVYYVAARSNWYPRAAPEFSTYDLTFRYPKKLTLVTPGEVLDDRVDGDRRITRSRCAEPIRFAGFNLGDYERVNGSVPGYTVEVYGNRGLEAALTPRTVQADVTIHPPFGTQRHDPLGPPPISAPPPDPVARLRAVAADVSSSLEFYSGLFGAPALKTLTVAPIPGTFGQGFPGLIYLSTIAYLEPSARPAAMRGGNQQLFYSDMMVAHEVAHQWWGNVVILSSYQDEWLMEAMANYSALLWIEKKMGPKAVDSVLDEYRVRLTEPIADGRTIDSAGPIVWGVRLESSDIPDAWRAITYDKGAWIMHMLRCRLGDERFLKMLAEMRRRYQFRAITSEDFRALATEFLPPHPPARAMDTFFDNWVYSTGVPKLKLQTSIKGLRVSGTLTQSGVSGDFSTDVPVQIEFAKGAPQIVWVRTSGDPVSFSVAVRQTPVRVEIEPYGVLSAKK